jgi:hypothetical protein
MRLHLATLAATLSIITTAMAQTTGGNSPPPTSGNRANGLNYQPTPGEVVPRERSAGVQAPPAKQQETNQDLERMDKNLMRSEGLGTQSVPKMTKDK